MRRRFPEGGINNDIFANLRVGQKTQETIYGTGSVPLMPRHGYYFAYVADGKGSGRGQRVLP